MAETVAKRRGSSFYLAEDTFGAIPISVAFILKSEASSVERGLEVGCAIYEKQALFDIVFLPEFPEKNLRQSGCIRCKQPNMKQVIRRWIDGGVQPILLVINPNHRFV
jgi:hypothetical protein